MGSRKRNKATELKELNKNRVFAKLNNCPTSPRKMRLVADQVRGKKVDRALSILKFSQKQPSQRLEKLLLSAINNWQQKTLAPKNQGLGFGVKSCDYSFFFCSNATTRSKVITPARLAPCPTNPLIIPCRLPMTLMLAPSPKTACATTRRPKAETSTEVTPQIRPLTVSSVSFIIKYSYIRT